MIHRYRHYGLTLAANAELPALLPAAEKAAEDVRITIRRASVAPAIGVSWTPVDSPQPAWREVTPGIGSRLRLRFAGDGEWVDAVIDAQGTSIELTLSQSASLIEVSEVLAADVFSCVLAQRGSDLSSRERRSHRGWRDRAGRTEGAGKSTLALALSQMGAQLLSDDVAAIRPGVMHRVAVGRSQARVTAETAAMVGASFQRLPSIWDEKRARPSKRILGVGESAGAAEVRLRGSSAAEGEPPPNQSSELRTHAELWTLLMRNRRMSQVLDTAQQRRDFARLGDSSVAFPATSSCARRPLRSSGGPLPSSSTRLAGAEVPRGFVVRSLGESRSHRNCGALCESA